MYQILFRIPYFNIPIYSYGLMMVIGFIAGIQLAGYLARRCGIDPELFVNAGLLALVSGVIGARLSDVLENIHQFTDPTRSVWANLFDAINIRSGGLTYYGGFLLAVPTLLIYAYKKKIPIRLGMDILAPCIVIGLGFGRIGCFLNGCCYGGTCDVPWPGVQFPYHSLAYEEEFYNGKISVPPELLVDAPPQPPRLMSSAELSMSPLLLRKAAQQESQRLIPAQLYSSFTAFLIAGIVLAFFTLHNAPGQGFAVMMILEGGSRFILELLRVEPAVVGEFSLSMIIGLAIAAAGVILWFVFSWLNRDPSRALVPA